MGLNKGQFTRQHSDETEGVRGTPRTPNYGSKEAGFCEVSGKWTTRLIQVGDQKVCKVVANKMKKMAGPCSKCGFPGSDGACLNEKCELYVDEKKEKEEEVEKQAYLDSGLEGKVTLAQYSLAMKAMQSLAQVTPEDGLDDEMEREQDAKDKRVKKEKTDEDPELEAEG